jgi:hypothetical protein
MNPQISDKLQIRLTSSVETIRASLDPYVSWVEEMLGVPIGETVTLEADCNPADCVAEELLEGLPVVAATRAINGSWRKLIQDWSLPPATSPRIVANMQRERKLNAPPLLVWELDWQDCPVAFKMHPLSHRVVTVKVPTVFPPSEMPIISHSASDHWFIVHPEDAAKVFLLHARGR